MNEGRNVGGHWYPTPHCGWGGFAEELFHHTSRYYKATEAFLRYLGEHHSFAMNGYQAELLSDEQRRCMAAVLTQPPDPEAALALMAIVECVLSGIRGVDDALVQRYGCEEIPRAAPLEASHHCHDLASVPGDISPVDPFISVAELLQLPVAVNVRHVEVSMHDLARHLDSSNSTLRMNLHNAIVLLHNGGFVLRNHPHLTHVEAQQIDDD